ncbi:MAG: hypothetical protein NW207_13010 [Cytophagales bacterium]|nr:hypothetical protein [Cytophagales bacterium]
MNKVYILIIFLFASVSTHAQDTLAISSKDTISIINAAYYYKGEKINRRQLKEMLSYCGECTVLLTKSANNEIISSTLGAAGAFCIGYPIGYALAGANDPPWIMAGAGFGLILSAIPFEIKRVKKLREAVLMYNKIVLNNTK